MPPRVLLGGRPSQSPLQIQTGNHRPLWLSYVQPSPSRTILEKLEVNSLNLYNLRTLSVLGSVAESVKLPVPVLFSVPGLQHINYSLQL
jgi:hypothetical protein